MTFMKVKRIEEELLEQILPAIEKHGLSKSSFSAALDRGNKLVQRMIDGHEITSGTVNKIRGYLYELDNEIE